VEYLIAALALAAFGVAAAAPGRVEHGACRTLHPALASVTLGRIAFSCYGETTPSASNSDIYVVRTDGTGLRRLTDGWGWDIEPAWSPDGRRIVFVSTRDGRRNLYVMNADGSGVRRLTDDIAGDGAPAWSPDGSRIAFESSRSGGGDIYEIDPSGSALTRLTSSPDLELHPAWSPDGSRIAFMRGRFPNMDVYVMNADGSGVRRLTSTPGVDGDPAWSPDGTELAFSSQRDLDTPPSQDVFEGELFTMRPDGTHQTRVLPGLAYKPVWSPDGTEIAFNSDRGGPFAIYLVHPDGTGLTQLVNSLLSSFSPNWSPAR
jgi:Tol biopolymer transport system component